MFNNLANKLAILDEGTELLGERTLLVVILFGLRRQVDVDAGTL